MCGLNFTTKKAEAKHEQNSETTIFVLKESPNSLSASLWASLAAMSA